MNAEHVHAQGAVGESAAALARQAQRLAVWARVVLVPVAVIGAVLSYQSLYTAAEPIFGRELAAGFPLLVDLLILGASLQYVAGAKVGRPMAGWRLTAHCGVAGTLALNALAAKELGEVPWHITAPAVWAVLVELTGKQVLGAWKATQHGVVTSIAPSLWISAPIESIRTRLLMARTGLADAAQARIRVGTAAAAREALHLSLPRRSNARRDARRVRRVVNRQLRAGSLPPSAVLGAVGWTVGTDPAGDLTPEAILRAVVASILRPDEPDPTGVTPSPDPVSAPAPAPAPVEVPALDPVESHPWVEPVELDPLPRVEAQQETQERVEPGLVDEAPVVIDRRELVGGHHGETSAASSRPAVLPLWVEPPGLDPVEDIDSPLVQEHLLRLEDAIAAGDLSEEASVEAVRQHLGIAWRTARTVLEARAVMTTPLVPIAV